MKIAYEHLIENIENKPEINKISERLFQLGHEHEIEDDIFDIEFTPNRGDCLSLRGLLRDLNLFYNTEINNEVYKGKINKLDLDFVNNSTEHCKSISFLKIEIDEVPKNYKNNLKKYFDILEVKKNNFFIDVSNYLSYETGQPTHCYDYEKLGNYIKLDTLKEKCEFETLLDKKINLDGENLVFTCKNNEVINLAGVIGGKNTACDSSTRSIILECAHFNPEVIMGKAVKYNLTSEAAHKFERNTDPSCHDYVLRRFIKIIEDHAKITNKKPKNGKLKKVNHLKKNRADAAFIHLEYPTNITANIHVSWVDSNKSRLVEIIGSKARILFDDLNQLEPIKIFRKGVSVEKNNRTDAFFYNLRDGDILSPKVNLKEPLYEMCIDFINSILTKKNPISDFEVGYECIKILKSLKEL